MSLPRYPEYKHSGVEWLGEVPAHWEVDRFKRSVVSCRNGIWGDDPQADQNDIPCVRVADFDRQRLRVELSDPTVRGITEKERRGRLLHRGDLLLEKSGGGELQPVGCVVLYDDDTGAVCSNFVARVELAAEMDSSFCRYQHAAAYAVRLNTRSIKQTSGIQNLDAQQYLDERCAFPPFEEQVHIAEFLDRETAKIDALVAEQQRLIELLKEKRQAVISHAVAKGLNPNAPMKDSGIEWLGEVPAHWEVGPVKRYFESCDGRRRPLSGEERSGRGGEFPYYGASGVIDYIDEYIFDEDLILVSEDGANLLNRATPIAFVATGRYWVNNHAHILRAKDRHLMFWSHVIEAIDLTPFVTGSAQPKFTSEALNSLQIASPPTEGERSAIERFIADQSEAIDAMTVEVQRAIDLLTERRTALISAAVTGQIDVRPRPKKAPPR